MSATRTITTETVCPRCGAPGACYFGEWWMHDADADAYACSLGNNWIRMSDGSIEPWDGWPAAVARRAQR